MKNQETVWLLKEKYQSVESEAFHADCARLGTGVPLAHLIGHVPFLDCTIHLDSHPLIPRPETEYWVEKAIEEIKKQISSVIARNGAERNDVAIQSFPNDVDCHASARKDDQNEAANLRDAIPKINPKVRGRTPYLKILDLCAGSGAVGVTVARAIPEAHVTFAELDPAHLPTIEKNLFANISINRHAGISQQFKILESDLFSNIENCNGFDFILTNPPYIDAIANTVDDNVREHEPHLALFGGVAGMEIINRIIIEAPKYLVPYGELWIEHEPAQVKAIATLAIAQGFNSITHPDQYGVPRFSMLTMAQ